MKKNVKIFLKGILILLLFLSLVYFVVGPNFLYLFSQNYMFDIEEVEIMGKTYIRGTLRWDFIKNNAIIFIFILYISIFLIINFLVRRKEKLLKERVALEIQERILSMKKGELNIKEPIYLEVDNLVRQLLNDNENINNLYQNNILKHNQSMTFLAHDLKTPLTSIYGYLTLLNDEPEITEVNRKKYIEIALSKTIELEELIKNFFELARFNMESQNLNIVDIDIYNMMIQMKETFYPMINKKSLTIEIDIEKRLTIKGDSNLIARALYNIFKNAVSYTLEEGIIKISSWTENNFCIISIENEIEGLDEETISHIFEPFYRSEPSRNKDKEGSGLGLAITKAIIEKHGGNIRAEHKEDVLQVRVILPL